MYIIKAALLAIILPQVYIDAARVLVIPHNVPSHIMYFTHIANILAEQQNDVVILLPSNMKNVLKDISPNVTVDVYQVRNVQSFVSTKEMANLQVEILKASAESVLKHYKLMMTLAHKAAESFTSDCEDLFSSRQLFEKLSLQQFDIVLSDIMETACYLAYSYKLGVPNAIVSLALRPWLYRVSWLPSVSPGVTTELTNDMTFMERLRNFMNEAMSFMVLNHTTYYVEKYVPEKPIRSGIDLFQQSILWFHLYDPVIYYPRESVPNSINIGDVMIRKSNPITKDYEDIMAASKNGVIIVSLGSFFDEVPREWLQEFCKAFSMVQLSVIWKLKYNPPCKIPGNVFIKKWLPQNDLLAHSNTKLFITHAGFNSYVEGVANAVPMIGFPLFVDQPFNTFSIEHKGIGIKMTLLNFTGQLLADNIERIVSNKTYHINVKNLSLRFKDKPESPGKRISYWINHVAEFGGDHLRSKAYDLSMFQFLMLDIYLFILVIIVTVIILLILVTYCSCKCIYQLFRKNQRKLKTN